MPRSCALKEGEDKFCYVFFYHNFLKIKKKTKPDAFIQGEDKGVLLLAPTFVGSMGNRKAFWRF